MWEISRENRIKSRADRYIKGEIDLQTFFELESIDEELEANVDEIKEEPTPKMLDSLTIC